MSDRIVVTRTHYHLRDANRDASLMRKLGGIYVNVTGKRGDHWTAKGKLTRTQLAKLAAVEAEREAKKT